MNIEFGIPDGLSIQVGVQVKGKSESRITLITSERKITRSQGGHPVTEINASAESFEGFGEAIHTKKAESRLRRALQFIEVGVAYASAGVVGALATEAITEGRPEFIGFAVICFTAGVFMFKAGDRNSGKGKIVEAQLQALETAEKSFALNQIVDNLKPPDGDISRN